nr:putative secreted protein [Quercus suber]
MLLTLRWLMVAAAIGVGAQDSTTASTTSSADETSTSESSSTSSLPTTNLGAASQLFSTLTTDIPTSVFTGSEFHYSSYANQITLDTSTTSGADNATSSSTSTNSQITRTSKSQDLIVLGGATTTSSNGTATTSTTTTAVVPTNTTPCNNYPEFCNRKYSNITEVCAHNAAFHIKNNIASNQHYGIVQQLNDGIRVIQGETHLVNETIYNCHTSCELLNAGTWQSELETITAWVESHPYDVVTILIANSDFADGVTVADYVAPIQNSGIAQYLYEPEFIPQHRDQWPTLGEMILMGKRVVMFMDYNVNQTAVPYVLDQYSHIWETPFSPTNQSFPCTRGRPPGLDDTAAREEFMYLANHNLNLAINLGTILGSGDGTILIPDTTQLNVTNGEYNQFGQLGAMSQNCTANWGRPPNYLVVDYYNVGNPSEGSVFDVAAQANGVTYNRQCCGPGGDSAGPATFRLNLEILMGVALICSILLACRKKCSHEGCGARRFYEGDDGYDYCDQGHRQSEVRKRTVRNNGRRRITDSMAFREEPRLPRTQASLYWRDGNTRQDMMRLNLLPIEVCDWATTVSEIPSDTDGLVTNSFCPDRPGSFRALSLMFAIGHLETGSLANRHTEITC